MPARSRSIARARSSARATCRRPRRRIDRGAGDRARPNDAARGLLRPGVVRHPAATPTRSSRSTSWRVYVHQYHDRAGAKDRERPRRIPTSSSIPSATASPTFPAPSPARSTDATSLRCRPFDRRSLRRCRCWRALARRRGDARPPARVRARDADRARAVHADGRRQERPRDAKRERQVRTVASRQVPLERREALQAAAGRRRPARVDLRRGPEPGRSCARSATRWAQRPPRCCPATRTSRSAFAWKDLPAADGLEWLGATPLAKDAAFTEIRIGFDAKGLAALELVDAFGQKSVVRFTNVERNPKFAPDTVPLRAAEGRRRHRRRK